MNIITFTCFLLLFSCNLAISSSDTLGSKCDEESEFAPCSCKTVMTGVTKDDVSVQFLESVCEEDENRQRVEEGIIGPKYWCYQLRKEITIFRNVENIPVEVTVKHKSGCELRCIERKCQGGRQKKLKLINRLNGS